MAMNPLTKAERKTWAARGYPLGYSSSEAEFLHRYEAALLRAEAKSQALQDVVRKATLTLYALAEYLPNADYVRVGMVYQELMLALSDEPEDHEHRWEVQCPIEELRRGEVSGIRQLMFVKYNLDQLRCRCGITADKLEVK